MLGYIYEVKYSIKTAEKGFLCAYFILLTFLGKQNKNKSLKDRYVYFIFV